MTTLPTWRYRICIRLLSPILSIHGIWRSFRDGGWRYAKERLGFVTRDEQERIHIHAASVGEVITVLPLVEKFQRHKPDLPLLITTNTPTGATVLQGRLVGNAKHAYLPVDFAGATQRFFARQSIKKMWVVETEIWPWLFARAKQRTIPVTIVNARLSHKSEGAIARYFNATYTRALSGVTILARSDEDARRYLARGADSHNVSTVGNLKTAHTPPSEMPERLLNKNYMLAASTHDDEELQLAQAWLLSSNTELLVLAPRHPERGARLKKSLTVLQKEIYPDLPAPAQRSLQQQPSENCRLYIADTLGELHQWYAYATAAFVGGSLVRIGGHNVLEPARTSTLIVVGPHTYNFSEEVAALKNADAIAIAENAEEVTKLFVLAQSNPQWAKTLSDNARNLISVKSEALDAYFASLNTDQNFTSN